jgi:hypothetical protein
LITLRVTTNSNLILYILSRVGVLCVTCRWGLHWMMGFIDTLYAALGTTRDYISIGTHVLGFSVFTSRILATDL